ncbi:MAG: universal stress protein [Myxococcales bacterium]
MSIKPYIVLVGVDHSELADRALQEAFALAAQQENAQVHALSILPVPSKDPRYAISVYAALDERAILETAIERLKTHVQLQADHFAFEHPDSKPSFAIVSHVSLDTTAHGIVQLASDLAADLIVIGTHNRKGVERFLLGSVAEATVRYAHCPVLVIPAARQPPPDEVTITPPCPECLRARAASAGSELWCAQHRERHGRRHTYHQSDRSSSDSTFPLVFR